ncbi:unnamed protein product [Effrenium voratum]|nr:unnamed protein product [Effrenium voratum]
MVARLGDSARPQVQPSATPEEDSAALVSAAQKPQSSGYAPTTPAKTPAPDLDSAPLMESAPLMDSAQFAEEAGAFIQNLSMKDLFGEEDDAEDGEAGSAPSAPSAASGPGAKRPRLEGS